MNRGRSSDPAEQQAIRWIDGQWVGEADGLATPPPRPPRWFVILIAAAVVGCFVLASIVLVKS